MARAADEYHVDNPSGRGIDPAVLTGFSLLRYDGFGVSPALNAVRTRLTAADPESISAGLNLMFTQHPDGGLTIGDTHDYDVEGVYASAPTPFLIAAPAPSARVVSVTTGMA